MTKQVKCFTTIDEQIELLQSRGIELEPSQASQWLHSVGYYRLSGFWYPYREPIDAVGGVRSDHVVPGTRMADIVQLYEFDRKLRALVHDGIERIEIALRSHISYLIGEIDPPRVPAPVNLPVHFRSRFMALDRSPASRTGSEA